MRERRHRTRHVTIMLRGRECVIGVEIEQSADPADGGPEWYFVDTGPEEIENVTPEEDQLIVNTIVLTHEEQD